MVNKWKRKWQPTPVSLPGGFQGQSSLAGYSPWDCKESDMTELIGQDMVRNIPLWIHIFSHSSVDAYLGCFCVLALVNSAAMNIGVQVSF